jgi:hypothetical protein
VEHGPVPPQTISLSRVPGRTSVARSLLSARLLRSDSSGIHQRGIWCGLRWPGTYPRWLPICFLGVGPGLSPELLADLRLSTAGRGLETHVGRAPAVEEVHNIHYSVLTGLVITVA